MTTNKELIARLSAIGKLPPADLADRENFPLKEFDQLLHEFTLPLDFETAKALINLSPPVGESCHEVEWALIHLVENYPNDIFQKLLDAAEDGEVKRVLQLRFDSYNRKK